MCHLRLSGLKNGPAFNSCVDDVNVNINTPLAHHECFIVSRGNKEEEGDKEFNENNNIEA